MSHSMDQQTIIYVLYHSSLGGHPTTHSLGQAEHNHATEITILIGSSNPGIFAVYICQHLSKAGIMTYVLM